MAGNDTNYDVALFKWGAITLLELASEFAITDPLVPEWRAIVETLTPGPIDDDGSYMVNSNTVFSVAHRHFSHLFHIYPLHVLTPGTSAAGNTLITKSLDKWTGLTCGKTNSCPNGFTFDGAASMSAMIPGREDAAVGNLTFFVVNSTKVHKSTMYSEGHSPCIESPLAAANSLQETLLQSWGGVIRVFPSIPRAWPAAMFDKLWAEGGIVVSARRENGATQFVQLCNRGDMNGTVTLQTDAPVACPARAFVRFFHTTGEDLAIAARRNTVAIPKGECIVCHQPTVTEFVIDSTELEGDHSDWHYFGQQ